MNTEIIFWFFFGGGVGTLPSLRGLSPFVQIYSTLCVFTQQHTRYSFFYRIYFGYMRFILFCVWLSPPLMYHSQQLDFP